MELIQEINTLKKQLAEQAFEVEHAKRLASANEAIRVDLIDALEQAYEFRDKYKALLKEIQGFKKTVKGRNAIERWVFDLKKK